MIAYTILYFIRKTVEFFSTIGIIKVVVNIIVLGRMETPSDENSSLEAEAQAFRADTSKSAHACSEGSECNQSLRWRLDFRWLFEWCGRFVHFNTRVVLIVLYSEL